MIMKSKIISIIFAFSSLWGLAQPNSTSLTGPYPGDQTFNFEAIEYINMIRDFSYDAEPPNYLWARINDEAILPPSYIEDPIVVNDRELDYSKAVGTIAGSHSVSLSGAVNYQMPVSIPPGVNGLQPNISLVYNSQGGNGLLGVGWNLSGLSAISRVPQTYYHDGSIKGVDFSDDRFAMDGQRLINIDDDPLTPYGSNGCQYYTEVFNGSRITSYGTAGEGPEFFIVETKEGLEIEFGNTIDSRIQAQGRPDILLWNINKITDKFGNYISFIYENLPSEGKFRIREIVYGCNENVNLSDDDLSRIKFIYGYRDDPFRAYIGGSKVEQDVLLKKIKVYSGDKLFRKYELDYHLDIYSHLIEVIETGKNGLSYNSTVFEWENKKYQGNAAFAAETFEYDGDPIKNWEHNITGDFNGDGRSDLLALKYEIFHPGTDKQIKHYMYYKIYHHDNPDNLMLEGALDYNFTNIVVGDYNGDGISDLILVYRIEDGNQDNYSYFKWLTKPSGFEFDIPSPPQGFPLLSGVPEDDYPFRRIQSADFNGDMQDDIICNLQSNYATSWTGHIMTSDYSIIEPFYETYENDGMRVADFNGDGKSDVMTLHYNGSAIYEYKGPDDFQVFFSSGYPTKYHEVYTGDFNGDGKEDVLTFLNDDYFAPPPFQTDDGEWELFFYKDDLVNYSWEPIADWPGDRDKDPSFNTSTTTYRVADFNGDGMADILEAYHATVNGNASVKFNIFEFTGSGFNAYRTVSSHLGLYDQKESFGDFTGNGALDFVSGPEDEDYVKTHYFYVDKNNDHIKATANGLNQKSSFIYKPITSYSVYSKKYSFNSSSGQLQDIQPPLYVAQKTSTDNGVGGVSEIEYKYKGARVHRFGKGYLGFTEFGTTQKFDTDDPTPGSHYYVKTNTVTHNPSPYYYPELIEKTTSISLSQYSTSPTSTTDNIEYQYNWPALQASSLIIFPYISSKKTSDHLKDIEVTEFAYYDDWGNLGISSSTLSGDISTEVYYNQYVDYGSWCPSKPGEIISKYYREGSPVIERKTEYQYYTDQEEYPGSLKKVISEPNLGKAVTTYITNYDIFGNAENMEKSSPGLDTRTSSTTYDNTGRYIISSKNPLDHSTSYTSDPATGQTTSLTDPNGLTHIKRYDGLNRLTKEIAADDNRTIIEYEWYQEDEFPTAVYSIKTTANNESTSITYYDILGRNVAQGSNGFDGTMILSQSVYNENGQLSGASDSYFDETTPAYWEEYKYDIFGRITETINPIKQLTYTYDNLTTSILNQNTGITTTKKTDASGLTVSVTDPGGIIGYTYYSDGQLKKINSPDHSEIILYYDEYGRQTKLVDPDAGITEYVYNAYGELEWQKDAMGNISEIFYDKLGRVELKKINDVTVTANVYDTRPNGLGLITSSSHSNGISYEYYYDGLSRIKQIDETIDDETYSSYYTYDNLSRIASYTYPSGFALNYEYNDFGYSDSIYRVDDNKAIYTNKEFNHKGQLTDYLLGDELLTEWEFDPYGFPESVKTGNIQHLEFSFSHQTGNLDYRKDILGDLEETFTYTDALKNRLNTWEVDGGVLYSADYYDNGSFEEKTDLGTYNYNTSTPYQPHAVMSITDPIQLPAEAHQEICYTSFNKVEHITHNEKNLDLYFTYGPDFSRKKTEFFSSENLIETKYFIGDNYEIEVDEAGKERHLHYIASDAGLIAIFEIDDGSEQLYYLHKDYLGSIQCISNDIGQAVEILSFDPWGNRRNPNDWSFDNVPEETLFDRGFTGHQHLDDFQLINMNGRVYDPILAQFLSPDNYIQAPYYSQNLNRYTYCLNNPLIFTDPSGNKWWKYFAKCALNPIFGFQEAIEWINYATEKEREWAVNAGVPNFNVGYSTSQGSYHSIGNSADFYHNYYYNASANSTEAILARTTVTFTDIINQDGINFVNNLGVSWDNVNLGYPDAANGGGESWYYGVQRDKVGDVGHSLVRTPNGVIYEINHPDYGQTDGLKSWLKGGPKAVGYRYDMNRDVNASLFWNFGDGRKMITWQAVNVPNPQASRDFFESWVGGSWDYNFFTNNCKHYIYQGLSIGGASINFRTNIPAEWPGAYSTPWYNPY